MVRNVVKLADKILALKIKANSRVCLWQDSDSVAKEIELSWREVRALALAVRKPRRKSNVSERKV